MTYEDYSHEEIETVCEEIFDLHINKLRGNEILFINGLQKENRSGRISNKKRDILIAMYDRLKQI